MRVCYACGSHETVRLAGIKVFMISEAYTSQECFRCHTRDKKARKTQGLYRCKKCGEENADRNAAFNIARKVLGYSSMTGVTVDIPITLPSVVIT
jgi:transposase